MIVVSGNPKLPAVKAGFNFINIYLIPISSLYFTILLFCDITHILLFFVIPNVKTSKAICTQ